MKRVIPLVALAGILTAACGDTPPPTSPPVASTPRFAFADGARGGNPDFFFLFPLGLFPRLSPNWDAGKADPDMKLVRVQICELPACANVIEEFESAEITVVRPPSFAADERDHDHFPPLEPFYRVIWRTAQAGLDPTKFYRIRVLVGDVELGFADIDPVQNLRQLLQVDRRQYVGVIVGLPFPIRFRIEQGALCQNNANCSSTFVDKDVGGTFYAADEGAAINFDPGDLPVDVVLTIERIPVPPGMPCVPDATVRGAMFQQWEGCYRISTTPDLGPFGGFAGDVEAAVCIEPGIPEQFHHNLLLYKYDNGQLDQPESIQPPFPFSCEGFSGTAGPAGPFGFARRGLGTLATGLSRFFAPKPLFAVDGGLGCILKKGQRLSTFFWGLAVNASAADGDDQEAPAGTNATAPSVLVTSVHSEHSEEPEPVSAVPVTFSIGSGGGSLLNAAGSPVSTTDTVLTNANGVATLPTGWAWRLGATPGVNTLVANGPFENGPVTFTATTLESGAISFETYPGGAATCISCPVTGDFVNRGVVFAFTPTNPEVEATAPQLILVGSYDPVGSAANHSVTAAGIPTGGFYGGTVSMYFPKAPAQVRFRLRGNNSVANPFPVSAYTGPGWTVPSSQITRSGVTQYTAGFDFIGREEIVTITSADGISRVDVPMNGFITLIDNLLVDDPPSGIINFEVTPDGEAICAEGCDVTTAFESRGVTFSFVSDLGEDGEPLTPKTNGSICDGSRIDPVGFGMTNHLVTGPMGYPCGGGSAGHLVMTFDPAPTEVQFAIRTPDGCAPSSLAFGADEENPFHSGAGTYSYTSGNEFTADNFAITWTNPGGISRLHVFFPGCDGYVDNLILRTSTP